MACLHLGMVGRGRHGRHGRGKATRLMSVSSCRPRRPCPIQLRSVTALGYSQPRHDAQPPHDFVISELVYLRTLSGTKMNHKIMNHKIMGGRLPSRCPRPLIRWLASERGGSHPCGVQGRRKVRLTHATNGKSGLVLLLGPGTTLYLQSSIHGTRRMAAAPRLSPPRWQHWKA